MDILKSLRHFLGIYTAEESYTRGRNIVDHYLKDSPKPDNVAQFMYNMSSGGFNFNKKHTSFDSGVRDRLKELGFDEDKLSTRVNE